ncbi:uncharacterized protein LOC111800112 [Cucurbita pepo subsp. pepo]|uniref:uncharacterized protein LOC111800112 n=1 Tax=Cucurbita pepo subsp. pepo TaxID=3664 RepID=UPI000C9D7E72|nr:uncharacterized protein LOC111800112 [Cucurbita pepo subsp. pepo]
MGVYVDDLIITRGDMEVLGRFKREMSKNFKMSDLGVLIYYLSIEVQQSIADITICQGAYAKKLLDMAELVDSNPTRTPMEAQFQLRKVGTTTTVDFTNYRSIVGSLRYLVNTRPDLAYSVGYVSRFMGVRYYTGRGKKKLDLVDYSDSDMTGDVDDQKSTSGMIYFLKRQRDLLTINKTKGGVAGVVVGVGVGVHSAVANGNDSGQCCAPPSPS